ncbi:hypothetical protein Btru_051000 [Bulinus truncatus]|nr:hypothetical protein Btru_051000 [Bulinus truncatus]
MSHEFYKLKTQFSLCCSKKQTSSNLLSRQLSKEKVRCKQREREREKKSTREKNSNFSLSVGWILSGFDFPTFQPTKSPPIAQCDSKADVIFVVDASERLGVSEFIKLSQLVADVVSKLGRDNFRLAEIIYGSEAQTILSLDQTWDFTQAISKLLTAPYLGGETCSHKGLKLAVEMLTTKRLAGVPAVVILVNDGFSSEPEETKKYAAQLKGMGATHVLAVGVGDMVDSTSLRSIASDYGNVFTSPSVNSVATLLDQITQRICQVSNTPIPQPQVQMQYYTKADVIYVVDSSEHVDTSVYNEILKLLANVAKSFNLGPNGLRLAEIVYGKESRKVFDLDNSLNPLELSTKILTSPYIGGETLTHQGLQLAYDMISSKRRSGVPVYVILVTDGYSSQPDQTLSQCNKIKQILGVNVMTVAVGDQINASELQKLVSDYQPIHKAFDINALPALLDPIVNSIKQAQPPVQVQFSTKADVIYVVDSSEHVDTSLYNEILKLLANVAKSFKLGKDGLRLAEIVYGKESRKVLDLDNSLSHSEIATKILTSPYIGGETLTHQGLQLAYDMISSKRRYGVPVYVIIVTDGYSSQPDQTLSYANKIKQISGANVMTVSIGDHIDIPQLQRLVSDGQQMFNAPDTPSVGALLNPIVSSIYQAQPQAPTHYSAKADVIYVVDSSEHVGTSLYNEILKLLANVAKSFNFGQDGLRLAEIVYGKESLNVIDLDNSLSPAEIATKILSSPFIGGETLAHQGLQMAYDMISYKSRKGVPVFVIHVTDGYSSDPEQTRSSADKIKQIPGVVYMAVAAGDHIEVSEVQKLVGDSKHIFKASDASSVSSLASPIVNTIYQVQVPLPTQLSTLVDLIFVVDSSNHVNPLMFNEILKLLTNVAKSFTIGKNSIRLAHIVYGKETRKVFDLDNSMSPSEIAKKILTSPYINGETLTHQGLQLAYDTISSKRRSGVPVYVILVNDGYSVDSDQTVAVADKIKQFPGVKIMNIALGNQTNIPEILKIVTKDQTIFQTYDIGSVPALLGQIVKAIYEAQPLQTLMTVKADVIYVVDSSEHVGTSLYNEILKLLANVAKSFYLGQDGLRLAEIVYGKESLNVIDLGNSLSPTEMATKILSSPFIGGETLAHQGLQMAYDMISYKSPRSSADKIKQIPGVVYMAVAAGDHIEVSRGPETLAIGKNSIRLAHIAYGKETRKVFDLDNLNEPFKRLQRFGNMSVLVAFMCYLEMYNSR